MQAEDFPNGTQEEHLRRELAEAKTSTAVAQKTIAENETARMKVELEKRTSEVQMMTERWLVQGLTAPRALWGLNVLTP